MYVHPKIEAIETARRTNRVTVSDLALTSGIERNRLSAVLNGITEEELTALRKACRTLKVKVPRG